MNKTDMEYKEIMHEQKCCIKGNGEKVVDSYEAQNFLIIISIDKQHVVWEYSYSKLAKIKGWNARVMRAQGR